MIKKVILVLLVIGALTGIYVYFFMLNKSHPDYENMKPDMYLSAEELFNNCRDGNALDYTGKLIEIVGKPSNLEINDTLYTLVYEFDEGLFGSEGVRATFLKFYNQKLNKIELNQNITIKAYCTGYNDTDVILEKASILKP